MRLIIILLAALALTTSFARATPGACDSECPHYQGQYSNDK